MRVSLSFLVRFIDDECIDWMGTCLIAAGITRIIGFSLHACSWERGGGVLLVEIDWCTCGCEGWIILRTFVGCLLVLRALETRMQRT